MTRPRPNGSIESRRGGTGFSASSTLPSLSDALPHADFVNSMTSTGQQTERALSASPNNAASHNSQVEATRSHPPTENVAVRRILNSWDAAALIMNKMIGGGIFTTPGQILLLTGNKGIALSFWAIGGIYCMISFSIYLEYGLNFPFNGGDLIYLDETWPVPELLATTLYSVFFLILGHNAGNAVVFAKYILAVALPNESVDRLEDGAQKLAEFDKRLVNLVAVLGVSAVSILLWVSDRTGLALNRLLAYYKVGLLISVFIAGCVAYNYPNSGRHDWAIVGPTEKGAPPAFSKLSAMIYIFYAYQGWENANYVTGELKLATGESDYPKHVLRLGGFLAVGLTTFLYIIAVAGYYMACSFDDIITLGNSPLGMGEYFASQAFGAHTSGFKMCIALSALGNLTAVVYSNSKVKQCIARQRIFPFSDWFAKDDTFGTPGPALFLNWLVTVIFVVAMPNSMDGYGFMIGIYSYVHLIALIFVGLGIFKLSRRMRGKGPQDPRQEESLNRRSEEIEMNNQASLGWTVEDRPQWRWKFLVMRRVRWTITAIFIGVNLLVLVVSAMPPDDGGNDTIPRYFWPIVSAWVIVIGFVYWSLLRCMMTKSGRQIWGVEMSVYHGDKARMQREAAWRAHSNTEYERMLHSARKDGDTRYVAWKVEKNCYGWLWKKIKCIVGWLWRLVSSNG